ILGVDSWRRGGLCPDLIDLLPGNYQFIAQDISNNCRGEALVTIEQDIPTISIDSNTNANCNDPNGHLVIRGVGGAGPYQYSVVPTGTPAGVYSATTAYDLAPGDYDIYVRDANGCESFITQVLAMDNGIPGPIGVDVTNQCSMVTSYILEITAPLTSGLSP